MASKPYSVHTFSTGLTVICVPMPSVKSATVLAMVRAGSRFEQENWAGISHFLEHMVFKGTEKYPNAQVLSSTIDTIGAEFNAFTSKDFTGYYVKAASTHLPIALDIISDMLLTPKLRNEDLEREKGVIVEELRMYEDTPYRHIGDVFEQVVFDGSTLGRDIIGSVETIRSLKRENFKEYLNNWYGLGNVVVVVAGDSRVIQKKTFLSTVETFFSKGKDKRKNGEPEYPHGGPYARGKNVLVQYKKTEQAHFILGFQGLKRNDTDEYALAILSALFGGFMSSRLFTEVREKRGLCYYVRSDVDSYDDAGIFSAAAGVDKDRVDEAVKVVKDEFTHLLDTVGKRKITAAEVARAKEHIMGSTVLSIEDSQNVALFYAKKHILTHELLSIDEVLERIQKVTLQDVQRVAKRLLNNAKPYFAIIGPYEDVSRFEKLLQ